MSELDDQDAVGDDHADHHYYAHQRHYIQSRAAQVQDDQDSDQPGWHGEQYEKGVDEGLELRHQYQVDENYRHNQSDRKAAKGRPHPLNHPTQLDLDSLRQAGLADDFVQRRGYMAEIFSRRRYVDIYHSSQLIMVDLG